ncbi:hypothetical protein ACSBR1_035395 [Camellia fascicularis]
MIVKILVRKSDGKALCAEAMEDFVDLLFSFLTIPLANVVNCLVALANHLNLRKEVEVIIVTMKKQKMAMFVL